MAIMSHKRNLQSLPRPCATKYGSPFQDSSRQPLRSKASQASVPGQGSVLNHAAVSGARHLQWILLQFTYACPQSSYMIVPYVCKSVILFTTIYINLLDSDISEINFI